MAKKSPFDLIQWAWSLLSKWISMCVREVWVGKDPNVLFFNCWWCSHQPLEASKGNLYKLNPHASFTTGEVGFGAIVCNSNGEPLISMQSLKFIGIIELVKTATLLNDIVIDEEAGIYPFMSWNRFDDFLKLN